MESERSSRMSPTIIPILYQISTAMTTPPGPQQQTPIHQASDEKMEGNTGNSMVDFPMDDSAPMTPQTSADAGEDSLFFADATLDLNEAHDIAETPEPKKIPSSVAAVAGDAVSMPSFNHRQNPTQGRPRNAEAPSMNRISSIEQRDPKQRTPPTYRPRPPRRPRDVPWLVGFILFVPMALLICTFLRPSPTKGARLALSNAAVTATFYCLLLALVASFVLARILYRTPSGGEGDDPRAVASQAMLAFAPISLAVHPLLAICIYFKAPGALGFALIPIGLLVRDLWAMRMWRRTASTAGGRQAFFQAITNMALDILSRSLRRSTFFTTVLAITTFQFLVVWWWRRALLGALARGNGFWLLVALLAGKWATGTVARILGFVASGGIVSWFVEQSISMEELDQFKSSQQDAPSTEDGLKNGTSSNMPEEYRSADASAYQPVLTLEEDYDAEDDAEVQQPSGIWAETGSSTVKAFMISALTISFGSVAQCGLLGGLAQVLWSVLRNIEAATAAPGFQGMQIGRDAVDRTSALWELLARAKTLTRQFVRSHTDLALSQVAAYYKNYQRAARDVSVLVDGSGKLGVGFMRRDFANVSINDQQA